MTYNIEKGKESNEQKANDEREQRKKVYKRSRRERIGEEKE